MILSVRRRRGAFAFQEGFVLGWFYLIGSGDFFGCVCKCQGKVAKVNWGVLVAVN